MADVVDSKSGLDTILGSMAAIWELDACVEKKVLDRWEVALLPGFGEGADVLEAAQVQGEEGDVVLPEGFVDRLCGGIWIGS